MPRKRILNPGASPRHWFGAEVKRAREAAGISQAELGRIAGCDDSEVSRVEGGLIDPPKGFPEACDRAFPHMGGIFTRFYYDSQRWEGPFPAAFRPFAEYEAKAAVLRFGEHSLVPGLLQVREYAHAVLSTRPNTTKDRVDELVEARLKRQLVLTRPAPPLVYALLDEAALHRDVGGSEIMHSQLMHLAELTEHPHITIRVVPFSAGAHSGLLGGFAIAETADSSTIVYLDTAADGDTTDDPIAVAHVKLTYDTLCAEAHPQGASRNLILRLAEQYEAHSKPELA